MLCYMLKPLCTVHTLYCIIYMILFDPSKQRSVWFGFGGQQTPRLAQVINAQLLAVFSIPLAATLMARGVGYAPRSTRRRERAQRGKERRVLGK